MEDPIKVTNEHLDRYFSITREALALAKKAPINEADRAAEIFDMAERYVSDAEYNAKKGNRVLAFACLNYAHGWLDAGARLGVFVVKNSRLFPVDD